MVTRKEDTPDPVSCGRRGILLTLRHKYIIIPISVYSQERKPSATETEATNQAVFAA